MKNVNRLLINFSQRGSNVMTPYSAVGKQSVFNNFCLSTCCTQHIIKKKYRKAEYVQRRVCFNNVQSSLHENVVFYVCARMCNAAYVIFIMWNSISGLDACYNFRLNISCGVAVTVRSHQKKYQVTF